MTVSSLYVLRVLARDSNTKTWLHSTLDCKPLLKWPGGKTGEISEIAPRIPPHNRYFEPFFGGGSVFFSQIEKPSYVNDIHHDLMKFYECVKNKNDHFFSLLNDFIDDWSCRADDREAIYMETRLRYNNIKETTIQKTVDFFILREYAYGGMFRVNKKGKFNVPFGHPYVNKDIQKKIDYLNSGTVFKKLKNLELHNLDFEEFCNKFKFNENDFMFVDPPYHCVFTQYNGCSFDEPDQERLADYLMSFKGKFMLVTQYTDWMRELYSSPKLIIHTYDKQYRFNIKGRFNRSVEHALITNYDQNIGS